MIVTPATPCYGKPCEVPAIRTCDHGDPEKSLFVPKKPK
jgi:hypothetical protein